MLPNPIHRAHEHHFLVPGQIAEIKDFEFAEVDQHSQRMRIFAAVRRLGFGRAAVLIRLPASRQRMVDHVAVAADDRNLHAGYGQHIARMRDHVFDFPVASTCWYAA